MGSRRECPWILGLPGFRAEYAFLRRWDQQRRKRRPHYIGLDEIQRGKGHQFWTVLSDIVHGEVIGLAKPAPRSTTCVGRSSFTGAVMRAVGRGKRWLLRRRWKTVRGSKRRELEQLFSANRRLFKAYVLREQLDRLWTCKTPQGVGNSLLGWLKTLRWQRLPEMERLGALLVTHLEGIAAYCFHPVRDQSGHSPRARHAPRSHAALEPEMGDRASDSLGARSEAFSAAL